jgi:lipopolysaccharide transport system ATP-binding protein
VLDLVDLDPAWRGRPRPPGRYRTTMWIPGDFLAQGRHYVDVSVGTLEPNTLQFYERHTLCFDVIESEPGAARGEWNEEFEGAVRPALTWTTQFTSQESRTDVLLEAARP